MNEATQTQDMGVNEDERLDQLAMKQDKTPEETQEFEKLRKVKDDRTAKSRIEELNAKAREAELKAERERTLREDYEKRLREYETKQQEKPLAPVSTETIEVSGKQFYTDSALRSLIDSGKMSETEAYSHQQQRIEEVAADKAYQRLVGEQKKVQQQTKQQQEVSEVFGKYPHWNAKHPDFNPNDPVYKTANEFFNDGMSIKKAMIHAERIHGKVGNPPDKSQDLSLYSSTAPIDKSEKGVKDIELSEWEKDNAIRLYRNMQNPSTGRNYTEAEAIAKAKRAKLNRPGRRM